ARALLHAAIQDPDPVIFYEPKSLYRLFREEVPEAIETMPIGRAQIVQEGKEITLISYGASVRATIDAAEVLEDEDGVKPEIIDLLSVNPMDTEAIVNSIKKTGKAVVIHEGPRSCGVGSEVIARINEHALMYLEAPIKRVTGYDVPIPYFARERQYLPDADKIVNAAREVLSY
ncbi:MAG: alpha-ketoacid dehydrogenase subunit beta, partial [Candidatus Obscuribacterales bacterium]|nr:alpha-ketoacid dehydrogenase subunit beta [Candidatus Obscuribacterales bacterium]